MGRLATAASDVRLTLPAEAENIPVIRHVLGAFAESLRLPADVVEDMRLAVTEACTNVVRHAYDGDDPGTIDVVIQPQRRPARRDRLRSRPRHGPEPRHSTAPASGCR